MGKGKFQPLGLRNPWTDSMKLGIHNYVMGMVLRQRGWSERTCDMSHVRFLSIPFSNFLRYSSARTKPALVDRFWRYMTCFHTRKCLFGGRVHTAPDFGVKSSKTPFYARESTFSSLTRKTLKLAYYRNYGTDPAKFCTATKTIKYSSWVVQTCVKQIQDSEWPSSWKIENRPYHCNG